MAKKIKRTPFLLFFRRMKPANRILFLIGLISLLGLAAGSLISIEDPVAWSLDIVEVGTPTQTEVLADHMEANYRTMDQYLEAYQEDVIFTARSIVPRPWMVSIFIISLVIGWSWILASNTYVRTYAFFLPLGLYLFYLITGGLTGHFIPDQNYFVEGGIILITGGLSWAFREYWKKVRLWLRLAVFVVINALPFLLIQNSEGWIGLHQFTAGAYASTALLTYLMIFLSSSDLSNLLFLLGTNAKNKKYRLTFPYLLAVWLPLMALLVVLFQKEMGWHWFPPEDISIRPYQVIIVALLAGIFTKQSYFELFRGNINQSAFNLGLLGLLIITFGTLFFHFAIGEFLFIRQIERMGIIFLTIGTLFHFFYMLYNFGAYIRNRNPFYYISMMPKKLMYFFVVIGTLAGGYTLDASQRSKFKALFLEPLYNRQADHEYIKGNSREAFAFYQQAVSNAAGSVKGNYNMGQIALARYQDSYEASKHFADASSFISFPYAYLNLANLQQIYLNVEEARRLLSESQSKKPNAYVANNLALLYAEASYPDSAILSLKSGLTLKPEVGAFYSNLGRIYHKNERSDYALKFYRAGLEAGQLSSANVTNALYYNLAYGDSIALPKGIMDQAVVKQHLPARYNYALANFKSGNYDLAQAAMDSLNADEELPEVLLMSAILLFRKGEVDNAITRIQYLAANHPRYAKYGFHYLGMAYFSKNVPEMAARYFGMAVEAGLTGDMLYQAQMELEQGNQEYAYKILSEARIKDESLWGEVSKEVAMLQLANGEPGFARMEYNLTELQPSDLVLVAKYAGQVGLDYVALDNFREIIDRDSTSVVPYLEMGRIGLAKGDSLTLENLLPGLKVDPQSVPLKTEIVRAYMMKNDLPTAEKYAAEIQKAAPEDFGVRQVLAELKWAKNDTSAIADMEKLYEEEPLNKAVVEKLARWHLERKEHFEGHELLFDAIRRNDYNPTFWELLAFYERRLTRFKDAGSAAVKARDMYRRKEQKERVIKEFSEEIRIYEEDIPEELIEIGLEGVE